MNKQKVGGGIEEWRDIFGYQGVYQVSNLGRVKRLVGTRCHSERLLKASMSTSGYPFVSLSVGGHVKRIDVHRLVAWAFIGEQGNLWVNHKNGDKRDNRPENLEYTTPSENAFHAYRTGLQPSRAGSANGYSKLTEDDVWMIRMVASLCLEDVGGRKGLANLMGVSKTTITEIINGNLWNKDA